jgi:drug/metabolite transporter (DMT)-like permease
MIPAASEPHGRRPARPALALAFTLVYLSWGTTYFAIKEGVKTLPPGLFGGLRIGAAGLVLLAGLAARRTSLRMPWRDFLRTWLIAVFLFVGGNGLITFAEKTVPSGVAAVLVATTPLWMALLESCHPRGERLAARGWLGVLAGLVGVGVLWADKLGRPVDLITEVGPLLVLGSAFAWSVGSFWQRLKPARADHLVTAAYQMFLGGGLALLGLALGEAREVGPEALTVQAVGAFFYLLVVGSLIGFVAYTWLLRHVSAALAGTYAYVNPVVALLVGRLLGGEPITLSVAGGMLVILAGVALIRTGATRRAGPRQRAARAAEHFTRGAEATPLAGKNVS